jgi:hypothetical protein
MVFGVTVMIRFYNTDWINLKKKSAKKEELTTANPA